jgi:hypothetical protein
MRTIPILAGAAVTLLLAGATMAASPSPTPKPSAKPTATPSASPSPSPSPSPAAGGGGSTSGTTASGDTFAAMIKPLGTTHGNATFVEHANGTGTLTVTLDGLRADQPWVVDVDGGTVDKAIERPADEIVFRSGMGVERVSDDTVRIHLTKHEVRDFLAAKAAKGVVVEVSDGTNRAAAEFTS